MSNNKIRKALQALKEIHPGNMTPMAEETWNKAIEILQAIIAEPVDQEPFGYFRAETFGLTDCSPDDEGSIALYEHPAPAVVRQPLTDEQIDALLLPESGTGTIRDLVRIIEAAHCIGGNDD